MKVDTAVKAGHPRARDCQTRKSRRASNSFRVLSRGRHIGLSIALPSCLQRERSLVLMLANAEDVLARALDVFLL